MCRDLKSAGTGDANATPVPGWHGGGGFLLNSASLARYIIRAPSRVNSGSDQRQWLLVKHRLHHFARYVRIDPVGRNHILAVRDDRIGVLHDLQPFEMVVVVETHAGAHNVENIDNSERPVALMRAQFAMVHVIDRDQRIDAGRLRRLQFAKL